MCEKMCEKAGQTITGPLTSAASGNLVVMGWACDRTDCDIYGYCPFSW